MKYLSEYRAPPAIKKYVEKIHAITTKEWAIMEVCGGQTHSLIKHGIVDILPEKIKIIHGPGCPVCVTPQSLINIAVNLALEKGVILCTFGDMLRVPGTEMSLLEAKARGADVRILYSPLEAITLCKDNPKKEVVFFAVGFETTAPANALSVLHARRENISNYSIITAHVLVPPAMCAIMDDPYTGVDGFLAAGHVCTIMGTKEYEPLVSKYKIPIVVTGFEPLDLVQGLWMVIQQLEKKQSLLENQYSRVVAEQGNIEAQKVIFSVFEISDRDWRGIGTIAQSGYQLKREFNAYDALVKFGLEANHVDNQNGCIAGEILKGLKKPSECLHFRKKCTPLHPMGAPMVSSEGACTAYYHYSLT